MEDKQPDGRPGFGDWRIRLGITLGVLVWSAYMAMFEGEAHVGPAWWTIQMITVVMLGVSGAVDVMKGKR
jgi:hypothetical protein